MNTLNEKKRLRRVVLLCCHFVRNLAYYREWHDRLTSADNSQIVVTIDGNFIDIVVMEWCKLFHDKNEKHYWGKVVRHQNFECDMLSHLGMTKDQFKIYVKEMLHYRDKFLAHLDNEEIMNIPRMDLAEKAVLFYHDCVVHQEACPGDLDNLPTDMIVYKRQCRNEVLAMLDLCDL